MSDPLHDFWQRDIEENERLSLRPVCEECKSHIQDEYYYETDAHDVICEECLQTLFDKWRSDNKILIH